MKSRKHSVSRVLFTMLATDESNGVALSPSPGSLSQGSHSQQPRPALGPGISNSGGERGHFPLEEDNDQSLEEGEEYEDELEEDPDELLDKHMKLLDSDVIPYHKKPGFCTSPTCPTWFCHPPRPPPHAYTHTTPFNPPCGPWAKHTTTNTRL